MHNKATKNNNNNFNFIPVTEMPSTFHELIFPCP